MRGWGRAVKRAVGEFYANKSETALAYSLVKYQQRDGWSTRDIFRLTHPQDGDRKNALFAWAICNGLDGLKTAAESWSAKPKRTSDILTNLCRTILADLRQQGGTDIEIAQRRKNFQKAYDILTGENGNRLIVSFEAAKKAKSADEIVRLILDGGLTREMVPTQFLNDVRPLGETRR
jgi:hypothetical protein